MFDISWSSWVFPIDWASSGAAVGSAGGGLSSTTFLLSSSFCSPRAGSGDTISTVGSDFGSTSPAPSSNEFGSCSGDGSVAPTEGTASDVPGTIGAATVFDFPLSFPFPPLSLFFCLLLLVLLAFSGFGSFSVFCRRLYHIHRLSLCRSALLPRISWWGRRWRWTRALFLTLPA